jgi:hypothetical protein
MRKFLSSVVGVLALFSATGFAGEPTAELAPKEAIRLIAMRSSVQENAVEIPFIVDGSAKCGEGFEVKHVRRVAAIHAVRDGASQSRRLVYHDFFWNEALGWFMWESRPERAGDAVYIWSELKGAIVNR